MNSTHLNSFIFILFSLWQTQVYGQKIEVQCKIRDAGNETSIGFAQVKLLPSGRGFSSDEAGHFKFPVLSVPDQKICIAAAGYVTDTFLIGKGSFQVFYLQPQNRELDEVVVSGTMNEVQRKESILPIEVYTPALFRKTWAPSLMESVNMINGVQPQLNCNVCSAGDIHINGLEGAYTMILIDGMPIVSSLSTVYGLAGIPQSLIKRIEVVKGPASTLYGSEALAGVINVITKDAGSAPLVRAELSGTSIGEFSSDISTKWKAGKHQALLGINMFHYGIPKDINHDNFTDLALQKRVSIFNKWDFHSKTQGKKSLAVRLFAEDRWGGEMQWSPRWAGSDSVYGESIVTRRAELLGTLPLSHNGNLKLDYSYNYHFQNSYYGRNHFLAFQHTGFAQLIWSGSKENLQWVSGIPVRFIVYDDNTPATQVSEVEKVRNQNARTFLPGIFAQADYQIIPKLSVLGGIRYDHHSMHGSIFTPRTGLKWKLNSDHSIRASGGSGFRVVNLFTEDHAALTGAREVVIAQSLKPEKSWNINLGYQGYFVHRNGFSNLEVNVFYSRFSNQIIGDFDSDPDKIIYDNLNGYGISRGVSLNFERNFENGWKAMAGITVMQVFRMNRMNNGPLEKFQQQFAPPVSGTFSLGYKTGRWMLDLTGRINGPMKLPVFPNDFRPEWSPVYPLVNMQASRQFLHGLELFAGIRNLLNFIPKNPILRPFDPFDKTVSIDNPNSYTFDPSYNYAPVQGMTGYAGIRWTLE